MDRFDLIQRVDLLPVMQALEAKLLLEGYRVHDYADPGHREHHLCVFCDQDLRVEGLTLSLPTGFKCCGACALGIMQTEE